MTHLASTLHARVAAFSRSRPLDDPEFIDARRDLAAVRLEEHVAHVVASSPPLTDDQRARIVTALTTSRPVEAHARHRDRRPRTTPSAVSA